jgi:hypothetical protein
MFGIDSLHIKTAGNVLLIILLIAIGAGYAYYIYKNSLPVLPKRQRLFLYLLRSIALASILFISAEPIISLGHTLLVKPKHYVFVDNSLSMSADSGGISRPAAVRNLLARLKSASLQGDIQIYSFGKEIHKQDLSNPPFSFNEPVTDFSKIFSSLKKENPAPSTVTILSDGCLTEGSNPLSFAEQAGIPVLTVGVGDTTTKKDIALTGILSNEILYPGVVSPVRLTIQNTKCGSVQTKVSLFEETKLIETRTVELSEGTNSVKFEYIPGLPGEKRLKAVVAAVNGEMNEKNNAKSIFVKIEQNKRKALLVAGYPSPDVTFLRQSLLSDSNIAVTSIIEISSGKTIAPINWKSVDSADVILFVHYPVQSSSPQLFEELKKQVVTRQKPLFCLIDENASLPLLRQLEDVLPVKSGRVLDGTALAQPILYDKNASSPLFSNVSLGSPRDWDNFAPISRQNTEFLMKPEGSLLLTARLNNVATTIPLLAARNIGSQRSLAFIGKDIWRWKLSSDAAQAARFDAFMVNAFKWLFAANHKENFLIRTDKKFYALNEKVEFTAELADENAVPISNAQIGISVSVGNEKTSLLLNALGNGLYEGALLARQTGDFSFTGTVSGPSVKPLQNSGKFYVGENQTELADLTSDFQFLYSLSSAAKGRFFPSDSMSQYVQYLSQLDKSMLSHRQEFQELVLWNNPWTLGVLILLFTLEWLLRKRAGML